MAGTKEIKDHIDSVQETRKITNAMYLIASTKLRRARQELDNTRPYFEALRREIKRILRTVGSEAVDSPYFYPMEGEAPLDKPNACLVITADKGLAGAYNQNAIKEALKLLETHPDTKLYVVGEYGRRFSPPTASPLSTASSTPPRTPPWPGPGRSAPCCWTALRGTSWTKFMWFTPTWAAALTSRPSAPGCCPSTGPTSRTPPWWSRR